MIRRDSRDLGPPLSPSYIHIWRLLLHNFQEDNLIRTVSMCSSSARGFKYGDKLYKQEEPRHSVHATECSSDLRSKTKHMLEIEIIANDDS